MSVKVNIQEAKTNFSKLINRVREGEEIIVASRGVAVARITAISQTQKNRRNLAGMDKGRVAVGPDFDEPIPREFLEPFFESQFADKEKE